MFLFQTTFCSFLTLVLIIFIVLEKKINLVDYLSGSEDIQQRKIAPFSINQEHRHSLNY